MAEPEPSTDGSAKGWDELFVRSQDVLEWKLGAGGAGGSGRRDVACRGLGLHVGVRPRVETLETFLGDSPNRPPPTAEEMAELREIAKANPGVATALRLSERGGLDVEAILAARSWRLRDDFRLFNDESAG